MMLNCKQTSVLVSQSLDRPLTRQERWKVRLHLLICVYCRRFAKQLKGMQRFMLGWQQQVAEHGEATLSDTARKRIAQRLDTFY